MSLLSYNQLCDLIRSGVIEGSDFSLVNSASIDIRLGTSLLLEVDNVENHVNLSKRESMATYRYYLPEDGYLLKPGQFVLAESMEVFNLPRDISAEYKLKSSMARIGLEHLNAGWCDAGWNGSVLTLELKNMTQRQSIRIRPGDKIGQMVFFMHEPVPVHASYANRGSYNGDLTVTGAKGEKK